MVTEKQRKNWEKFARNWAGNKGQKKKEAQAKKKKR